MTLPEAAGVYYAVVSTIALITYAWDKRASKRPGARRIRERTLHGWALAGGFAGAWLGQAWLRHKTRHPAFVFVTMLSAVAHAVGWAWWLGWL